MLCDGLSIFPIFHLLQCFFFQIGTRPSAKSLERITILHVLSRKQRKVSFNRSQWIFNGRTRVRTNKGQTTQASRYYAIGNEDTILKLSHFGEFEKSMKSNKRQEELSIWEPEKGLNSIVTIGTYLWIYSGIQNLLLSG